MEATTVNVKVDIDAAAATAQNRQIVQKWGIVGQQIYTIVPASPDLRWKEDQINGRNNLRAELKTYLLKAIDITSVAVLPKDLDGFPKIVVNEKSNDPSLVFPMAAPDFKKATRDNVIEAIERSNKPGSKPVFFEVADLPMLLELLKQTNGSILQQYEEFARKFMSLTETVRGHMDSNERIAADYYRQCGVNPNAEVVEVKAKVTVE